MAQRKRYRRASSAVSSVDLTGTSLASSPPPAAQAADDPCSKKAKFEKRFDTANNSNEDILRKSLSVYLFMTTLTGKTEKQLDSWSSKFYSHYHRPSIVEENGEVTYVFVCKK
jgi:hypothetical protein